MSFSSSVIYTPVLSESRAVPHVKWRPVIAECLSSRDFSEV